MIHCLDSLPNSDILHCSALKVLWKLSIFFRNCSDSKGAVPLRIEITESTKHCMAVDAPKVQPEQKQRIAVLSEDDCAHTGVNSAKECFRLFIKEGSKCTTAQRKSSTRKQPNGTGRCQPLRVMPWNRVFSCTVHVFPEFCSCLFSIQRHTYNVCQFVCRFGL